MRNLSLCLAAFALALPTLPAVAQQAKLAPHSKKCRKSSGTTGLVAGGVAGAVLGSKVIGGGLAGTAVGAVGGAFAGRAIDRTITAKKRCH